MKKTCPVCGSTEKQVRKGYNRSGTQRRLCNVCGAAYTMGPEKRESSEGTRTPAIKMYDSGVSGRGVGKVLGRNTGNVYRWIKKTGDRVDNSSSVFELGELHWYIERTPRTETRENVYIMTMASREPRQIVGFDGAFAKSPERIQRQVFCFS